MGKPMVLCWIFGFICFFQSTNALAIDWNVFAEISINSNKWQINENGTFKFESFNDTINVNKTKFPIGFYPSKPGVEFEAKLVNDKLDGLNELGSSNIKANGMMNVGVFGIIENKISKADDFTRSSIVYDVRNEQDNTKDFDGREILNASMGYDDSVDTDGHENSQDYDVVGNYNDKEGYDTNEEYDGSSYYYDEKTGHFSSTYKNEIKHDYDLKEESFKEKQITQEKLINTEIPTETNKSKITDFDLFDESVNKNSDLDGLSKGTYNPNSRQGHENVASDINYSKFQEQNLSPHGEINKVEGKGGKNIRLEETRNGGGIISSEQSKILSNSNDETELLKELYGRKILHDFEEENFNLKFGEHSKLINAEYFRNKQSKDLVEDHDAFDKQAENNEGLLEEPIRRKYRKRDLKSYLVHTQLDDSNNLLQSKSNKKEEESVEMIELDGIGEISTDDEYDYEFQDHDDDEVRELIRKNIWLNSKDNNGHK